MIPEPEERIAQFESLGFGMFIHYGLYSLMGKGEWIQYFEKIPRDKYAQLMSEFKAEKFRPREIAALARQAGMKYIVLTTRHHEGFSLYDTRGLSDFDITHSAAGRDLVAEFAEACRAEGIIPFLYHTTLDWHNPDYDNNFPAYLHWLRQSVEVLCTNYGKIGGFWFDGNWDRLDADWQEDLLYEIIRKHQPEAVIINNPGMGFAGKLTNKEVDVASFEQGRPVKRNQEGCLKYTAGEMSQTINGHWGCGKNDFAYKSVPELIKTMCVCRGAGANYLLNIGPDGSGKLPEMACATLKILGKWIDFYRKPFYQGRPVDIRGEGDDFVLQTPDGGLFFFVFGLSDEAGDKNRPGIRIFRGITKKVECLSWVDTGKPIEFFQDEDKEMICFHAAGFDYGDNMVVRAARGQVQASGSFGE